MNEARGWWSVVLAVALLLVATAPEALAGGTATVSRSYALASGLTGTGALACAADLALPEPDHGASCFDVLDNARAMAVRIDDAAPWAVGARARVLSATGGYLGDVDLCGASGTVELPAGAARVVVFLAGPATGLLTRLGVVGSVGPDCGPFGGATAGTVELTWST